MGGYLPWLPGAACSATATSLSSSSSSCPDSKQKTTNGFFGAYQPSIGNRRRFNQPASEPQGLGGLLPLETSPSSFHTVLRRGFSLPSKRQSQVQPIDSFFVEVPSPRHETHNFSIEKLQPLSIPDQDTAVWPEQGNEEENGDGESDNDSIASEEWAEALWSPGRQAQPTKFRQGSDGRRMRSLLSDGKIAT